MIDNSFVKNIEYNGYILVFRITQTLSKNGSYAFFWSVTNQNHHKDKNLTKELTEIIYKKYNIFNPYVFITIDKFPIIYEIITDEFYICINEHIVKMNKLDSIAKEITKTLINMEFKIYNKP